MLCLEGEGDNGEVLMRINKPYTLTFRYISAVSVIIHNGVKVASSGFTYNAMKYPSASSWMLETGFLLKRTNRNGECRSKTTQTTARFANEPSKFSQGTKAPIKSIWSFKKGLICLQLGGMHSRQSRNQSRLSLIPSNTRQIRMRKSLWYHRKYSVDVLMYSSLTSC